MSGQQDPSNDPEDALRSLFKDQFQPTLLEGRATRSYTEHYFDATAGIYGKETADSRFRIVPGLDLAVSRLGFGSYRVARNVASHYEALHEALLSGTNVIDTSTNYADGSSENMIGQVLSDLVHRGKLSREQIVVVTKAGYVQGRNLKLVRQKEYPGLVDVQNGLKHCISPEFLNDQIELSRQRLGLETIDVFLLHNPEYYLKKALSDGVARDEARTQYYSRIKEAFNFLEQAIEEGRIAAYGISSNTFVEKSESYTKTDLSRILSFAPSGFRVVQFPANLLETGFRQQNDGNNAVCDIARRSSVWTLANRPLNALLEDRLFRLAGLPDANEKQGRQSMEHLIEELESTESKLVDQTGEAFRFDERTPAMSSIVSSYLDVFESAEQLNQSIPRIIQIMQKTVNRLRILQEKGQADRFLVNAYIKKINHTIEQWELYVRTRREVLVGELENEMEQLHPALKDLRLSQQAVRYLLSGPCPDTVLAGMRNVEYVKQLSSLYGMKPAGEELRDGVDRKNLAEFVARRLQTEKQGPPES